MKIKDIEQALDIDAIRQRLGYNEGSTEGDKDIEELSPQRILELWSGWHLGSEDWATIIIEAYNKLNKSYNTKTTIQKPSQSFPHPDSTIVTPGQS